MSRPAHRHVTLPMSIALTKLQTDLRTDKGTK